MTSDHSREMLRMVNQWKGIHGWSGLGEKVLQMVGLTNQEHLPYRDWAMREITEYEYVHLMLLGVINKFIIFLLAWIQTFDPDLVCVCVPCPSCLFDLRLPWINVGNGEWRADKPPSYFLNTSPKPGVLDDTDCERRGRPPRAMDGAAPADFRANSLSHLTETSVRPT